MKKRQTKAERDAALAEKKQLMAERGEKIRELLARGPDPSYPVTKLSIEEQIALGIPLSTGWVTTVRPPFSSRRKPKLKTKP
jgi:hypothetical protein